MWVLNVSFLFLLFFSDLPIAKLRFGTILKTDNIKEGDDIFFECIVQARPPSSSLQWYHNVSQTYFLIHFEVPEMLN